jgi:hypothetical protein
MGVLREEQSFAARVLRERGVNLEEIRKKFAEFSPSVAVRLNQDELPHPDQELQSTVRTGEPRYH